MGATGKEHSPLLWQISNSNWCLMQSRFFKLVCRLLVKDKVKSWCLLLLQQETLCLGTSVSQQILGPWFFWESCCRDDIIDVYVILCAQEEWTISLGLAMVQLCLRLYFLEILWKYKATPPPMTMVWWKNAQACKGNDLVLVRNPFLPLFQWSIINVSCLHPSTIYIL